MFTALTALSTIALMGFFARKNHKNGWVKHREPMIENLGEAGWKALYSSAWGEHIFPDPLILPEVPATSLASFYVTAIDVIGFTQQLQNMEASLKRLNVPGINPALTPVGNAGDLDKITSHIHQVV